METHFPPFSWNHQQSMKFQFLSQYSNLLLSHDTRGGGCWWWTTSSVAGWRWLAAVEDVGTVGVNWGRWVARCCVLVFICGREGFGEETRNWIKQISDYLNKQYSNTERKKILAFTTLGYSHQFHHSLFNASPLSTYSTDNSWQLRYKRNLTITM